MYKSKRILALVPARGGSKGLPGKNIRPLLGKPLIQWTLESAKKSKHLDKIFVSTDSREIADVCENAGVAVPGLRPDELASDTASSMDVMLYSIELLEKAGDYYDYLLLLEPTSPLRKDEDIDRIIELAIDNPDADGVISCGQVHTEHPSIIKKTDSDGYLIKYYRDVKSFGQRQFEDEALFPYGVGYLIKIERFKEEHDLYTDRMIPYKIERWQNYEVDDIYDFECISAVMNRRMSCDE